MTTKVTAMKAILKSDRRVVLEVELLCQWVYITERRTESTYSDKEGNVYRDYEIEIVEYQGGSKSNWRDCGW